MAEKAKLVQHGIQRLTALFDLQIAQQNNEESYREILGSPEFQFLYDCGVVVRADTAKMADKEAVVSSLCHHFLVTDILAELEQIRSGLNTLHFLSLLEDCPNQMMPIFQPANVLLSAETLEDLFIVKYSEPGSNQRATEEQIVFNFFKLLRDIEEGQCVLKYGDVVKEVYDKIFMVKHLNPCLVRATLPLVGGVLERDNLSPGIQLVSLLMQTSL